MGFLDSAGLAYLWGKVRTALGLKMDVATYDPTGKATDVFGYADTAINGMPVKKLVGTRENPVDLDNVNQSGYYVLSGYLINYLAGNVSALYENEVALIVTKTASTVFQNIFFFDEEGGACYYRTYTSGWEAWGMSIIPSITYVDTAVGKCLPFAGGTLTGPLTLSEEPTQQMQAANKGYVDSKTPLLVTVTENSDGSYTADHTAYEVYQAFQAGQDVFSQLGNYRIALQTAFIPPNTAIPYAAVFATTRGAIHREISIASNETENMRITYNESKILPKIRIVTLPAASWDATAKTQTVSVAGVLADETKQAITPTPAPASWEAAGLAGVRCSAQAAGKLTFACSTVPTVDLTYNVLIQEAAYTAPVVPMISFSLLGVTYQAENGMTIEDWINSKYNPGIFIVQGSAVLTKDGDSVSVELSHLIQDGEDLY